MTLDQGGVFGWIDRNVGAEGAPDRGQVPGRGPDRWSGQGYWWDVEFWNESAVDTMADMSVRGTPPWPELFDPRTGAAPRRRTPATRSFYGYDTRFRLAGIQHHFERDAYIVEPERPWRADWGHARDLARRLHAAAHAGDDHRLREAGAVDAAAPLPDDREASNPDPVDPRPVSITSGPGRLERGRSCRSSRSAGSSSSAFRPEVSRRCGSRHRA